MRLKTGLLIVLALALAVCAAAAGWVLGQRRQGFADTVEKVAPSVVTLYAAREVSGLVGVGERAIPLGSGFVTEGGRIATSASAVGVAPYVMVQFADGRRVRARPVGRDETADLALLRAETREVPPALPWGDSRAVRPGDWALIIGAPHDLPGTVTAGVVSGARRRPAANRLEHLQTDADLGRLSLGAPVLDVRGRVIGVADPRLSQDGRAEGAGFALSSHAARPVIVRLAEDAASSD